MEKKNTAKPAGPCAFYPPWSRSTAQPWQVRQQELRREEIMVIFVEAAAEIVSKLVSLALRKRREGRNLRNNEKI